MLDLKGASEWVVTTKLGSSDVRPGTTPTVTRNCRLYAGEMAMSAFVLGAAFYGVFTVNRWTFSIFLFLQVSPPLPSAPFPPLVTTSSSRMGPDSGECTGRRLTNAEPYVNFDPSSPNIVSH